MAQAIIMLSTIIISYFLMKLLTLLLRDKENQERLENTIYISKEMVENVKNNYFLNENKSDQISFYQMFNDFNIIIKTISKENYLNNGYYGEREKIIIEKTKEDIIDQTNNIYKKIAYSSEMSSDTASYLLYLRTMVLKYNDSMIKGKMVYVDVTTFDDLVYVDTNLNNPKVKDKIETLLLTNLEIFYLSVIKPLKEKIKEKKEIEQAVDDKVKNNFDERIETLSSIRKNKEKLK